MRENGLIPTMEDIHWRTFHHFFSNLRARMKSSSCTEVSNSNPPGSPPFSSSVLLRCSQRWRPTKERSVCVLDAVV